MSKGDGTVVGKGIGHAESGVSWVSDLLGGQDHASADDVAHVGPDDGAATAVAAVDHAIVSPEPAPVPAADESPLELAPPVAPPATPPRPPLATSAPAPAAGAAPPLLQAWPAEPSPQRQRQLPPRALMVAGGVLLLFLAPLLWALATRKPADEAATAAAQQLPTELLVDERDIQNRVQVRPEDFHPRGGGNGSAPPGAAIAAPPLRRELDPDHPGEDAELAERQARRAKDPEDLIAQRFRSSAMPGATEPARASSPRPRAGDEYRRPVVYLEPPHSPAGASGSSGAHGGTQRPLVPAGTVLPVVLATPLRINGGSAATVLVKIDGDAEAVPAGTRLVGSATADDTGLIAIRFSRLLIPDRHELKIDGEAQDSAGGFGIPGQVASQAAAEARNVAKDVAADTASDVASDVLNGLTGGLGGSLARNLSSRTRGSRYGGSSAPTLRVSLGAGAHFSVFLHEAVVESE